MSENHRYGNGCIHGNSHRTAAKETFMLPNAEYMIHQPMGGYRCGINKPIWAIAAEHLLKTRNTLKKILAENSGQVNRQKFTQMQNVITDECPRNTWIWLYWWNYGQQFIELMIKEGKLDWVCFFGIIGRDFLERGFTMFEKVNRSGLIVYLYALWCQKLQDYGDITYHSKKHRYFMLFMFQLKKWSKLVGRLGKEKLCVEPSSKSSERPLWADRREETYHLFKKKGQFW